MFEAAVSRFVKSVGKQSLVAVPDLDEANQCRPLQVVIKKRRRWFWQSAKYEPTPFSLHQLLTDQSEFTDVKQSTRELTVYNKTYKFNVDGKIGGKLKILLDAELSGQDTVQVEAKFGQVNKVETDIPVLMDTLSKRKLNMDHEFVKQIRENPRNVLCVITGVAQVSSDATVHMHVSWKGEEKFDIGSKGPITNEDEDAEIDDNKDKTLTIPKDTPLAFNLCEISVEGSGDLELMVEDDSQGGFDDVDGSSADLLVESNPSLEEQFGTLTKMEEKPREEFRNAVLDLCAAPINIPVMLKLLKAIAKGSPKPENPEEERLLPIAQEILGLLSSEDGSHVDATVSLFEALIELDDDETVAFRAINRQHAKSILYVLHQTLEREKISITDKQMEGVYDAPNPGQTFLTSLGFQIADQSHLVDADDNIKEIEGAYCAVYALWYDPHEDPEEQRTCCIL